MAAYLQNAIKLLGFAVLLPILSGVFARLFFFRRDADDISLHPQVEAERAKQPSHQPEPSPVFEEAWPSFSPRQQPVGVTEAAVTGQVSVSSDSPVRLVYSSAGLDVGQVMAVVERRWQDFRRSAKDRPRYDQWTDTSPFALSGAAGGDPSTASLTVEFHPGSGVDAGELVQIWESEILPELRQEFGTNPFQSPQR
jgi:hypothetical protein